MQLAKANICAILFAVTNGVEGTKRCGLCGDTKPVEAFHRRGRDYQAWCKSCRRLHDAAYHARTRQPRMSQKQARIADLVEWMRLMKSKPCADCGGRFHPAALAFDHLPGTSKRADVADLVRRGSSGLARLGDGQV